MKNMFTLICLLALASVSMAENDLAQLKIDAANKAKTLGSQLKQQLSIAMQAGGPIAGVEVCHSVAEDIATQLSTDGWQVGRTSLKNRSSKNAPDEWEVTTMQAFDIQHQKDPSQKLVKTEIVTDAEGQKEFRFMAAIPTAKVCTQCHGNDIKPAVLDLLHKYYPNDLATGFKVGDLRGAFSVSKIIDL